MAKRTIEYQETYNAGNVVNKVELLRLMQENNDKMEIEMKQRTKFSDGKERITITIEY